MAVKKKRAGTVGQLGDVHKMFTEFIAFRLKETNPNRVFTEDEMELNEETGEYEAPFVYPMGTAEMGVIAKFLKDNEITCEPDDEVLEGIKDEFADDFQARRSAKANSILSMTTDETEQQHWIN